MEQWKILGDFLEYIELLRESSSILTPLGQSWFFRFSRFKLLSGRLQKWNHAFNIQSSKNAFKSDKDSIKDLHAIRSRNTLIFALDFVVRNQSFIFPFARYFLHIFHANLATVQREIWVGNFYTGFFPNRRHKKKLISEAFSINIFFTKWRVTRVIEFKSIIGWKSWPQCLLTSDNTWLQFALTCIFPQQWFRCLLFSIL